MIELRRNVLEFSFPDVHPKAKMGIRFIRTLRIPDDGKEYFLPPGLGNFPLRNIDDFAGSVNEKWLSHGGVMLPMYQSEALWLSFNCGFYEEDWDYESSRYPFAIKVSTGKINAINGDSDTIGLKTTPQNYLIVPKQPWLDGYCVKKGIIRQFVAMPLGAGYSAEEQITGKGEHGGLQIEVYPMKYKVFEELFPERKRSIEVHCDLMQCDKIMDMGLAPGGSMKQEIYADRYGIESWDTEHKGRCFVHIANSLVWRSITGENPPKTPFTAKEYTDQGFPWFDYYDETAKVIQGSDVLAGLKSVAQKGKEKGDVPLPENTSVTPENVVKLRAGLGKDQVREGSF